MSDNVNVLIEKMNQESLKKNQRGVPGGPRGAQSIQGVMNAAGQDDSAMTIDENGNPVRGGVGAGLVPGNLPKKGPGGAKSVAGQSMAGKSGRLNASPTGRSLAGNRSVAGGVGGLSLAEQNIQTTDKAIVNLMKEYNKLKKRLEMI